MPPSALVSPTLGNPRKFIVPHLTIKKHIQWTFIDFYDSLPAISLMFLAGGCLPTLPRASCCLNSLWVDRMEDFSAQDSSLLPENAIEHYKRAFVIGDVNLVVSQSLSCECTYGRRGVDVSYTCMNKYPLYLLFLEIKHSWYTYVPPISIVLFTPNELLIY